jgi:hypothetical protein
MGFRSLDEVVEASENELASVPGVSAEQVATLRSDAAKAMENLRQERLAAMAESPEAPTERAKLLLVRGVNARVADQLEQSGYASVEAVAAEEDTDRLAIKTGLGAQKAQALKEAVREFITSEWPPVEAKLAQSIAKAEAEAAAARAQAEAEAEAAKAEAEAEAVVASAVAEAETRDKVDAEQPAAEESSETERE